MRGAKDRIAEEKQKMDELVEKTTANLNARNNEKVKVLEDEVALLKQLLESRRGDLETQRETLLVQRDSYRLEIEKLEHENGRLRQRLEEVARESLSSLEALKVKMGVLHQADVQGLADIHEARLTGLAEELAEKSRQAELTSTRLHQELQAKLHLRKEYELETSRLKSRVMDLRIQLNAVQIEMKDNVASMKSQLDVTSQGLIRDSETKARTLKSCEDEMRKLRQTIDAKDEQLRLVEDNAAKKEEYYRTFSEGEGEKVANLKRELDEREKRKGKELAGRDEEIGRLRRAVEELKEQVRDEEALRKRKVKELEGEGEVADEKLRQALKEAALLRERVGSLEHDLNLTRGDIEVIRFEQEAAANEERGKTQQQIGRTQGGFKEYYEQRLKELEADKLELQAANSTQAQHINGLVAKYRQLEDALKAALDSQKRLGDLETRILHLGLDNNLVKNLAELLKRPFH